MGQVQLTDGNVITVDEGDETLLASGPGVWGVRYKRGKPYVARVYSVNEDGVRRQKQDILSRLIASAKDGEKVYFMNGDPLDLRRANLQVGAGPAARRIVCPITPGRLEELYWTEGWSSHKIAAYVAELLGRSESPVQTHLVIAWLREAGVRIRNRSESTRVRVRRRINHYRAALAKARRVAAFNARTGKTIKDASRLQAPAVRRKIRTTKRRVAREALVQMQCARMGCFNLVTRRPGDVAADDRKGRKLTFCSHSCAAMHWNKRRGRMNYEEPREDEPIPDWITGRKSSE